MDQNLHVDEEYKRSFNDGYTLAKELGMNKESLKDIAAGNQRMVALREGMEQFEKDAQMQKDRDKLFSEMDKTEQEFFDKDHTTDKDIEKKKDDLDLER